MFNFPKILSRDKQDSKAVLPKQTEQTTIPQTTAVAYSEDDKLTMILSAIQDAVIALDLQENIVLFNLAAEKLTGATAKEVIGKPIDQIIKVYEYETEIPKTNFVGVVYIKQGIKIISFKNRQVYVNFVSGQIKEGNQANLSCILILHDVTEEKNFETMKLDFVSIAAHELRTPLTSIKGYLSVFMNENKGKFDSDQTMFLTRISISTEQLLDLVENLLSVSKIERGIFNVNLESTDWTAIVQEIFNQLIERAKEKNLEFTFIKPESTLPKVMVDKLRIVEVLSNLFSNAIAYTSPGGKIQVNVKLSPDKQSIITSIQDTGEGIPKEAIPHLFTKFFRVSGRLEQGSKGTGLGLYISREIIRMHHGEIWVDSELGKGSTFSFSLPVEITN